MAAKSKSKSSACKNQPKLTTELLLGTEAPVIMPLFVDVSSVFFLLRAKTTEGDRICIGKDQLTPVYLTLAVVWFVELAGSSASMTAQAMTALS